MSLKVTFTDFLMTAMMMWMMSPLRAVMLGYVI